ncbi:carbohydrate ABC transporter permease [Pseudotabrizicola algicola]|uniref:Sugar ABC transporter permease n=1 Tax=Pseudotabrizicola algicola TaxID=2709381 RepID=A0A6B3RL50_9RHOB|nr:sugar ABC transporter permease [Pseudotabrizicola algicola]NEX46151.1 sugar ABC transporter permease [Pseudotabrizicola algicola]
MKPQDNRAWLLLLPASALMAFVGLVPLVTVLNFSFHDIFMLDSMHWVGAEWYESIITSPAFHASLARSLLFSALALGVQLPLGIAVALMLLRAGRLGRLMLLLVAVPLVVPWNMIPIMWLSLVNPDTGLAGQAMRALGIAFDYKFTAWHTWALLVVMDTWHWLGLVVILAYAGLSGIPPAYHQAAAIDGASRWQRFRFIELPRIMGALFIVILLRFVDSFMIYTEAFAINAGGPNGATTFLSLALGEEIKGFSYGSAAAHAMVYFLIVVAVVRVFVTATDQRKRSAERGMA